jgi:hypothetical protein
MAAASARQDSAAAGQAASAGLAPADSGPRIACSTGRAVEDPKIQLQTSGARLNQHARLNLHITKRAMGLPNTGSLAGMPRIDASLTATSASLVNASGTLEASRRADCRGTALVAPQVNAINCLLQGIQDDTSRVNLQLQETNRHLLNLRGSPVLGLLPGVRVPPAGGD